MSNVLVIAPHPDDETLGCGGTLLKHKSNGDEIYWVIITNINEDHGWEKSIVEERQKEINDVANAYGFKGVFKLDFPTTKLDIVPIGEMVSSLSMVVNDVKPEIVYIPNRSDIHTDHQISFKVAMSCVKNFRSPFVKKVLMYETCSETEFAPSLPENPFVPNLFVDISLYFDDKLEIFKMYSSEIIELPLPRSLKSIATVAKYRGSRIGVKYAEAFMLLEEIL